MASKKRKSDAAPPLRVYVVKETRFTDDYKCRKCRDGDWSSSSVYVFSTKEKARAKILELERDFINEELSCRGEEDSVHEITDHDELFDRLRAGEFVDHRVSFDVDEHIVDADE